MSDNEPKADTTGQNGQPQQSDEPDIVTVPIDEYLDDGPAGGVPNLGSMGKDPLERILLEQVKWFHDEAASNISIARRAPDFHHGAPYFDLAAKASMVVARLAGAYAKLRGRSEQKMIVEHRTPASVPDRTKRDLNRSIPRAAAARPNRMRTR